MGETIYTYCFTTIVVKIFQHYFRLVFLGSQRSRFITGSDAIPYQLLYRYIYAGIAKR